MTYCLQRARRFLASACFLLLGATPALAHHPGHVERTLDEGAFVATQLNVDHAAFDIMARRGTWTRFSLETLYAPLDWLEFRATLPLAWVREEGKDEAFGFSDMELGVLTRPFVSESERWVLETGLMVELPTGSVDKGLGGGHVAIIPKLGLSAKPTPKITLGAELFTAITAGAHAHAHGPGQWHSMMAIHSLYEFGARAQARYTGESGYVAFEVTTLQGLAEPSAPGPSSVRLKGNLNLTEDWLLASEFEIPFAGQRRVQWRASLGVAWRYSLDDEERCPCETCGSEREAECACEGV